MKWLLVILIPMGILTLGAIAVTPVSQQNPPFILEKLDALEEKVATLEQDVDAIETEVDSLQFGAQEVVATPVPVGNTFEEACINGTLPLLGAGQLGAIRFPEGSEYGVAAVPGMDIGGIYRDITGGRAPTWDSQGISPGGFAGPTFDPRDEELLEICLTVYPGYTIQFVQHELGSGQHAPDVFEEGNHWLTYRGTGTGKYRLKATGLKNNRAIVVRLLEYRRCISTLYAC